VNIYKERGGWFIYAREQYNRFGPYHNAPIISVEEHHDVWHRNTNYYGGQESKMHTTTSVVKLRCGEHLICVHYVRNTNSGDVLMEYSYESIQR